MNSNQKGKNNRILHAVEIPQELYQSLKGKYFVGYADELNFGRGTSIWARLYNPPNSGVNLHVNVWTITDVSNSTFRAQFWFNSNPSETPIKSEFVTPQIQQYLLFHSQK